MTLTAYPSEDVSLGYFRVFATPPGGFRREITIFRSAPVMMTNAVLADPFTHQTAQLSCPQITPFDTPGQGDLDWLAPNCDIDIVWENTGPYDFEWSFEGLIVSWSFSVSQGSMSFTIDLKGAFYGLDDYLAIPSFPKRPVPYEILIAQAFDQSNHPANLGQFRILFPSWLELAVPEFNSPDYLSYLKPWGVATGQLWTGFTSRTTGSWDAVLSGHVQSLLTVMFAENGAQWSIRNRGSRRPELYLREIPNYDDDDIIEIVLGSPGVDLDGSQDFTQRASVIYGQGTDDAGISYSGLQVSPDGRVTTYRPFAYSSVVWPRTSNPRYDRTKRAKEVMVRFQDGVDELSAQKIAKAQLQRFAEPGITGTITLSADVRYADGTLCPRMLLKAGKTIRISGLYSVPEGILAHITQVNLDFQNLTVSLEYDTKYRDQLTVEEVKARTRDALTPLRSLQTGKYSNTIQDLVLPWSYAEGSGMIPMGSKEFFLEKLPSTSVFPHETFTKQYPPRDYPSYYIKLSKTDTADATNNWGGEPRDEALAGVAVRMAQSGTIRLSQFAAYDKDGNVLPVRFHISIYNAPGVNALAMPMLYEDEESNLPNYLTPYNNTVTYADTQHMPFFENAWETVFEDGTQPGSTVAQYLVPAPDSGLVVGWGTYYEPAGYSPGRFSRGAARTGLLEDTTSWTWELNSLLDLEVPENNTDLEYSGMLFVMIYCDEQGDDPVYFMGKLTREDPGAA